MKKCLYLLLFTIPVWLVPAQTNIFSGNRTNTENTRNTERTENTRSTSSATNTTDVTNTESAASIAADAGFLNPQLAMSNADYHVTAGDVYTLTYAAGNSQVTYPIVVDATYRIRISNLGVINASGKTFLEIKARAETIVSNNYPLSGAQFVLTRPALFTVYLKGEVVNAAERPAWALSRLSSFLEEEKTLTDYSSLREVSISSAGGRTKVYDVFKARREGDLSQDPYVRPGDVIMVGRVERSVSIRGAVERPGTYQILEEEGLADLVSRYGGGLTPVADTMRVEMIRYVGGRSDPGDKVFLSQKDIDANYRLNNLDEVYIPTVSELTPVMFVEGAVDLLNKTTGQALNGTNRLTVRFNEGESYASVVQRNREWFSAESDTKNAYLLRDGERITMNLNPMLYDLGYRGEYYVEENDTLVVPFRQYFVTVSGAVAKPGRYPYIPDRAWDYYVALAGGFDSIKNSFDSVAITDITGRELSKKDEITPETIITARTNGTLYYFNQFAPVVTTILTVISTTLSIYLTVTR